MAQADDVAAYPGQRLGLPAQGAGSVAGWGRRIAALCIDWAVSLLIVSAFVDDTRAGVELLAPLAALFVQLTLLTWLLGASFGQRLVGVAVARLDGRPLGVARAALRSLLICLAIPPLISDRDSRGLHDLAAGTVVLRR